MSAERDEAVGTLGAVLMSEPQRPEPCFSNHVGQHVAELVTLAGRMHRRASRGCKAGWSTRDERAQERDVDAAEAIAALYGAGVEVHGDPRGFVLYIKLASGRHNSCAGAARGWGVPSYT